MGVLLILAVAPQFFFCEYDFSRESNFEYLDQWSRSACVPGEESYEHACSDSFINGVDWYLARHTDVLYMIVNGYTVLSRSEMMDTLRKSAITYSVADSALTESGGPDAVVYFNDADKETEFRLSNIMMTL